MDNLDWSVDIWSFDIPGAWEWMSEMSPYRAFETVREFDPYSYGWAIIGWLWSVEGDSTAPVLLASSAYAPAGELMARLRGEVEAA